MHYWYRYLRAVELYSSTDCHRKETAVSDHRRPRILCPPRRLRCRKPLGLMREAKKHQRAQSPTTNATHLRSTRSAHWLLSMPISPVMQSVMASSEQSTVHQAARHCFEVWSRTYAILPSAPAMTLLLPSHERVPSTLGSSVSRRVRSSALDLLPCQLTCSLANARLLSADKHRSLLAALLSCLRVRHLRAPRQALLCSPL